MGAADPRRVTAAALAAALLQSAAAPALELRLGLDSEYLHNTNFNASRSNPDAANSFQLGPRIDLSDARGPYRADLQFVGGYQVFLDQEAVDNWESRVRLRGRYALDRRTVLRVAERFRDLANLRFSREDIALGDTAFDTRLQDRYRRNDFELALEHARTRRLTLDLRAAHQLAGFERNDFRADSESLQLEPGVRFRLSSTHEVGAALRYTRQYLEDAETRIDTRAQFFAAAASWDWTFARDATLRLHGGPAWVEADEEALSARVADTFIGTRSGSTALRANVLSCDIDSATGVRFASRCDPDTPGAPPIAAAHLGGPAAFLVRSRASRGDTDALTFLGGAILNAALADWSIELEYRRRPGTTSGDTTATRRDRASLDLEYAPGRSPWRAFLAATFDRRENLTDASIVDYAVEAGPAGAARRTAAVVSVSDGTTRRDAVTAVLGAARAFGRNVLGIAEVRYRRIDGLDQGRDRAAIDNWFFAVSLRYLFDPLRF